MRTAELVRRSAEYLARHGVESSRQEAETLLMRLLGVSRAELYTRDEGLDARTARSFGRALCLRCKGTPLQHLTGEQQFLELSLKVAPAVFVPRPETEIVALATLEAIDGLPSPVVVDVGTGTGALALVAKHRRSDARVFATDLSPTAVDLARSNAVRLGLDVDVRAGDLFDPLPQELRGAVDVIVSNPPYISPAEYEALPVEVRAEPYQALVGGTDLHRRLVEEGVRWLRPGGWLVVEIGSEQGTEVRRMFAEWLAGVEVLSDLAGRDRVVRGTRPLSGRDSHSTPP
jgi:release factor glutamine methyltransferase